MFASPPGPPPQKIPSSYAPNPDPAFLPVLISDTSVQDVPSQDSTAVGEGGCVPLPAILNAFELLTPSPALTSLLVFKSLTSVQELPFQDSVFAFCGG